MNKSAEAEVIKAAYTAMARKYHPDHGGVTTRMKEINEAYEVLSDPIRKARYDEVIQQRQNRSGTSGSQGYQSSYSSQQRQSTSGASDEPHQSQQNYRQRRSNTQQRTTATKPPGDNLLPLVSWKWQRIALFASFPIAIFLAFIVHHIIATIAGLFLLAAAIYACISTRFLARVKQAGIGARLAAGFVIALSLISMGLIAISIAIPIAIPAILACALLPLKKG